MNRIDRQIKAHFQAQGSTAHRIAWADFQRVVDGLQKTLMIVGEDIAGRRHGPGRIPQSLAGQLSLDLVAIRSGSFAATLELAEQLQPALMDVGVDALDITLASIQEETLGGSPMIPLAAREAIRAMWPRGRRYDIRLAGGKGRRRFSVPPDVADRLSSVPISTGVSLAPRQLVGRLLEVDFKDHTAEVWDASGSVTRVRFPEEMADRLQAAARQQVAISGVAGIDSDGRSTPIDVAELQTLGNPDDFWSSFTADELAEQQGVGRLESIESLSVPSIKDDVEDLLEELANLRKRR